MAYKSKALSPFTKTLLNNVKEHCSRTNILSHKDDYTIVACSGGVDSIASLIVMKLLKFNVKDVVYVNHRMRPTQECAKDVEVVKAAVHALFASSVKVHELCLKTIPKNETEARDLRYEQFIKFYEEQQKNIMSLYKEMNIITAHHLDDQIETFLMKALKGSRLDSLKGACPQRTLNYADLTLLRPLLTIQKIDLKRLVEEFGLEWHEDVTNKDNTVERNFVRNELLPNIYKMFPAAKSGLIETMIKLYEAK